MELLNLKKNRIIRERITFRLSRNFLNQLNVEVAKKGVDRSSFIRGALEKELGGKENEL
jgi:predicted DNA binding CopG/RHH family protein